MLKLLKQYSSLIYSCISHSLLWIGLMLLVRYQNYFDLSGKDYLWTVFFSIVGVIYAITVAFLLVIVLEKYKRLDDTIIAEINLMEDVRDFLIFIKNNMSIQKKIYKSLLEYARFVYQKEWQELKQHRENNTYCDSDTSKELYQLMEDISKLEPKSKNEEIALREIITKIGEITTLRTIRVNLSAESLSPILYFYLRMMGAILTVPFILLNGGNVFMQGGMVLAIVSAIKILYSIIKDFDNPLVGFWNVQPTELKHFLERENNKDLNKLFFS